MSVSLYRKYRPQTFGDIIGQKPAVDVLTNSVLRGKVGHAYLFSGSRGCGKTSAARIFAKALNCSEREGFEPCGKCRNCTEITAGESLDVIEIDGASNNGVDNIRSMKENVTLSPFNSRYKIYIIDEVHMLSQGAFNALLKTLEEPPGHVIFIMATTEPHKVPVTIRSRCQHIPFRSITPDDIFTRLEYVCTNENITFEAEALREISRQADGALRDALSLLEQVSASGNVTLSNTEAVLGSGSRASFERWIVSFRQNVNESFSGLRDMLSSGSPVRVFEELFTLLRDLLIVSQWKNNADSLGLSKPERDFLLDEAVNWKPAKLYRMMKAVLRLIREARMGVRTDVLLGIFMFETAEFNDPEYLPPSIVASAMKPSEPAIPAIPATPVAPSAPVTLPAEDPALKAEILSSIRVRSFPIWCAMFDARVYLRGKDLLLDIGHRYTFNVMKIERNAADIAGTLNAYPNVILRYRDDEYTCPRRPASAVTQSVTAAPSAAPAAAPATVPVITPIERPQMPETSSSVFVEIMRELASMGMKPEILCRYQTETNDSDNDSQEGETDNDA